MGFVVLIAIVGAVVGLSLVAQLWLATRLAQQSERMQARIEALEASARSESAADERARQYGLPPGSPAPGFDLPDLAGEQTSLDGLLEVGQPLLLVFTDPSCGPCNELM